jgi:hypothetical protein
MPSALMKRCSEIDLRALIAVKRLSTDFWFVAMGFPSFNASEPSAFVL